MGHEKFAYNSVCQDKLSHHALQVKISIFSLWIKVFDSLYHKGVLKYLVFSLTFTIRVLQIGRMQILGISVKILLTGAKHFSEWLPFFVRADRNHFTDHHEAKFGLFRTICVNLWDSWDVIELPISNLTSRVAFQVIKLYQFYPFNCLHRYFELSLRCRSDLSDFEHTEITRTHGNFPLRSWQAISQNKWLVGLKSGSHGK